MRRRRALGLVGAALLLLAGCARDLAPVPPVPAGALRIASHNVHYIRLRKPTGAWSVADWEARRDALDAAFKALRADVVAFQEMESFAGGNDGGTNLARDWLLERNPGYAAAAVGDWRDFPSTQPILYRREALRLDGQGWFFFSDTPDVIYSRTFDGSYPAFASWARFVPREGPAFHVVNVHFEYSSRSNRRLSAELVARRIAPWLKDGTPVFVVGDLNAWQGAPALGILERAGVRFVPLKGATYHLNHGLNLFPAIDHLGHSEGITPVGGPGALRRRFAGDWPSDHYPIWGDFRLGSGG